MFILVVLELSTLYQIWFKYLVVTEIGALLFRHSFDDVARINFRF